MCSVLLPPGVNPIAVNKYIIINKYIYIYMYIYFIYLKAFASAMYACYGTMEVKMYMN